MKKLFAILVSLVLICGMSAAFAFNWNDVDVVECDEYVLSATKYVKIDSDLGVAYEKAPNAMAKVGDYVYFDLFAADTAGEEVDADVEYHHLSDLETVGKLFRAKVIGAEPWVKISITEKTAVADLKYKNEPIVVEGTTIVIGDLVFTRNADGVVVDVNSNLNVADMLAELAELGIDIQKLYDGKICMNDDVLIANFGRVCETSAIIAWYVQAEAPQLGIPKTGDAVSIIAPALAIAAITYVTFRKR